MSRTMVRDGLGKGLESRLPRPLARLLRPPLFAILGIDRIDAIYNAACDLESADNFAEKLLHRDVMDIGIDVESSDLTKIPREGPLVIVANHPFGAVDGIALLALLKRVRPDVKLMANYILGGIPNLKEHFFLVDPFEKADSSRKSLAGTRSAFKWLNDGHVLGIFPAGEVASYDRTVKKVVDKPWGDAVGMLIQRRKCPVQTVFFSGHNSRLFQLLGRINPALRTLWLARECNRACHHNLSIKIGDIISAETCCQYETPKKLMVFLRQATYALSQ